MATFEDNPKHRRAKLVRITPRGEAVLRRIEGAERDWADAVGEGFEERELRQAAELLERVRHALGPQGPASTLDLAVISSSRVIEPVA